jgi:hypothetical protein
MKTAQDVTFNKLKQKQNLSGGFAWFEGNTENRIHNQTYFGRFSTPFETSNNENTTSKSNKLPQLEFSFRPNVFTTP